MTARNIIDMLSATYDPDDLLELCAQVFPQVPGEEGYSDRAEWICSAAQGWTESAYKLFSGFGGAWLLGHLGQNRATGKWDCYLLHPRLRDEDGMVLSYAIGGASVDQDSMAVALLVASLEALCRIEASRQNAA